MDKPNIFMPILTKASLKRHSHKKLSSFEVRGFKLPEKFFTLLPKIWDEKRNEMSKLIFTVLVFTRLPHSCFPSNFLLRCKFVILWVSLSVSDQV